MNFFQMACIQSIARTHSFSTTAKQLSVNQQTISRNVKAVEDELELKLFVRNSQFVQLTEAGRLYLNWLSDFDKNLKYSANKYQSESRHPLLKIAICEWSGYAPAFWRAGAEMEKSYPERVMEYLSGSIEECAEFLEENIADVIIIPEPAIETVRSSSAKIISPVVGAMPLYWMYSTQFSRDSATEELKGIFDLPLVLPKLGGEITEFIRSIAEREKAKVSNGALDIRIVPNMMTAYAEVMCGNAYTITPQNHEVKRCAENFRLREIEDRAMPIVSVWKYNNETRIQTEYLEYLLSGGNE